MINFIHDDFLLQNEIAKKLYHQYAKQMPIIDYHCHLDPQIINDNIPFDNIYEIWLSGDHYKWRMMRANGILETHITGNIDPYHKFLKWAETVPLLIGNPLYHWTHLELKRFFNIDDLLNLSNADEIYHHVNDKLKKMTPRDIIEMSNVEIICTTDDPVDQLNHHLQISKDPTFKTKVIPAFRPDKGVNIEAASFIPWIKKLEEVVGYQIKDLESFEKALSSRVHYFHQLGSRLADHALDVIQFEKATSQEVNEIFKKGLQGITLDEKELKKYKGYLLVFLGKQYHNLGWVQQYHIGAFRNLSTRNFNALGPDTGFDGIQDQAIALPLRDLLDTLDLTNQLPKTILYTLNPRDFEVAITLMQAFQGDGIAGKIQFGSAWWFLDTIDGMTKQIKALANNGLLSRFVGMLTDSRSFLSYPRHEYFRRLLCNIIGEEVHKGLYPNDEILLGKIVQDIAYGNAKAYFNF
jgi:glucuronate isomerase